MSNIQLPPRPKGILFDLGDTLVTVKFYQDGGLRRLMSLASNPHNISLETIIGERNRLVKALLPIESCGWEVFRGSQFNLNLFDRFGITFPQGEDIRDLEFARGEHDLTPEPQVFDMLDKISELGIPLGIVSNSGASGKTLRTLVGETGMLKYFKFLMSSADYGFTKPGAEIFKTAVTKLGANPQDTWFVGNVVSIDVAGAEGAGLTGIWYNQHKVDLPEDDLPDYQVRSWNEFADLVKTSIGDGNE